MKKKTESCRPGRNTPEVLKTRKFDAIRNQSTKLNRKWMNVYILPFPNNYRGITLTAIAAKVYNALLLTYIKLEIEKILIKKSGRLSKSTTPQILKIRRTIEGVPAKNPWATTARKLLQMI